MGASIVLAEDNAASLQLMSYLLQTAGHTIRAATDGIEALVEIGRARPDLVLLDVQMPRMGGYEAVRALRSDRDHGIRRVTVVAVTAYAMVGDRDKVLAAGFDGYITKPIAPETFVSFVEAFLPEDRRTGWLPRTLARPDLGSIASNGREQLETVAADILVVDDSPEGLAVMHGMLVPSGFAVRPVRGLREALREARRRPPDLIVSDLRLRDGSGLDLMRAAREDEDLRHVPVVLTTASSWIDGERRVALALGAADFIVRPIDPHLFVERIRACLVGGKG